MIALHRFMGACPLAGWDRTFVDPQDIAQFFFVGLLGGYVMCA